MTTTAIASTSKRTRTIPTRRTCTRTVSLDPTLDPTLAPTHPELLPVLFKTSILERFL